MDQYYVSHSHVHILYDYESFSYHNANPYLCMSVHFASFFSFSFFLTFLQRSEREGGQTGKFRVLHRLSFYPFSNGLHRPLAPRIDKRQDGTELAGKATARQRDRATDRPHDTRAMRNGLPQRHYSYLTSQDCISLPEVGAFSPSLSAPPPEYEQLRWNTTVASDYNAHITGVPCITLPPPPSQGCAATILGVSYWRGWALQLLRVHGDAGFAKRIRIHSR